MSAASKRLTQVATLTLGAQLIALVALGKTWAVLLPPVLASFPTALLTMRSPETIRMMAPKLRRAYVGIAVVSCAVIAAFALLGNDLSFNLQFVRAMFAGLAILWLASTVAVHAATLRDASKR